MPRHLAWLLLLPQLFWRPLSPEYGGWRLLAFDVGQGSAILLQTATHQLLFDTGWGFGQQDAVARYVLPELKALGIRHLDDVVISHPDQDHIGGLATLEKRREIGVLRGSGLMPRHYVACRRGQRWSYDGVAFIMLAPLDNCASRALKGVERNRCSCVLKIQGTWHSALLPGDIDSHVERQILEITLGTDHTNKRRALRGSTKSANKADMDPSFSLGSVDVVLMAHHGSRYSSDPQWVKALSARHAISQSGRHNRYGHPHPEIEQRWQKSGAEVWATVRDGAILVESNQTGLWVQSERKQRRRYWHRTDKPHEKHHQEEP